MKWTPENDQPGDDEKPTPRAITERLVKIKSGQAIPSDQTPDRPKANVTPKSSAKSRAGASNASASDSPTTAGSKRKRAVKQELESDEENGNFRVPASEARALGLKNVDMRDAKKSPKGKAARNATNQVKEEETDEATATDLPGTPTPSRGVTMEEIQLGSEVFPNENSAAMTKMSASTPPEIDFNDFIDYDADATLQLQTELNFSNKSQTFDDGSI
ncbi:MAG: hypothetical protein M1820_005407 [Bogoriella megaspora]|nr:MAG: hypothetical protein M1820_005407 [Bogoriella megaspora]